MTKWNETYCETTKKNFLIGKGLATLSTPPGSTPATTEHLMPS